jgi:hypothetical protein
VYIRESLHATCTFLALLVAQEDTVSMNETVVLMLTAIRTLRYGRRQSSTTVAWRDLITSNFVANTLLSARAMVAGRSVVVIHFYFGSISIWGNRCCKVGLQLAV